MEKELQKLYEKRFRCKIKNIKQHGERFEFNCDKKDVCKVSNSLDVTPIWTSVRNIFLIPHLSSIQPTTSNIEPRATSDRVSSIEHRASGIILPPPPNLFPHSVV